MMPIIGMVGMLAMVSMMAMMAMIGVMAMMAMMTMMAVKLPIAFQRGPQPPLTPTGGSISFRVLICFIAHGA